MNTTAVEVRPKRTGWTLIKDYPEQHPWPTEATLRQMYRDRDRLGMGRAFLKFGRRILVHPERLQAALDAKADGEVAA
jgi:hypothetical protein